jgi:hypothetical protein
MIHYQLRCETGHEFDGWFAGSAGFESQAKRGLLECPICGTARVDRALMAPAVPRKGRPPRKTRKAPQPQPETTGQVAVSGERMPDQMLAVLQRMRAEIERNCDYVGDQFAEEARRIHRGESERKGIYGEATADEAEALVEEGIDVSRIPWVPRADG